ncbi:hypothetical protein RJ639_032810, partial [Escallonia herrerae]
MGGEFWIGFANEDPVVLFSISCRKPGRVAWILVGDVGPVLDMMAAVLEKIPTTPLVARTTISTVCRTAQIICSIPNISYYKKDFPDALFHHLLIAMAHPDHETRVEAHRVFSTVLMPSVICPFSVYNGVPPKALLSVPPVMPWEVKSGRFSIQDETENASQSEAGDMIGKESQILDERVSISTACPSCGQSCRFKHALPDGRAELDCLRLSSHQMSLLLSSIWVQATSTGNTPANFEAMAHTYNLALLFTSSKKSSQLALVRCFQLAFSLRRVSLNQEGNLQPSRRRSLFTLSSCMLIFSARAGNLPELVPAVKSSLTKETVDPYLELVEDTRLQAVGIQPATGKKGYGSQDDEVAALRSLSAVEIVDQQLQEAVISHFMTMFGNLAEDELSSIRQQLLEGFSPDDEYPLGVPLFMETPRPSSPHAQIEFQAFDEVIPATALTDEEAFPDQSVSHSGRKASLSINSLDVLNVNQLLESVLETARQVASFPVSPSPIPYDQVKSQCEALVTGKQQKMSALQSFKLQQEAKAIFLCTDNEMKIPVLPSKAMELLEVDFRVANIEQAQGRNQLVPCSQECVQQQSFRLPPSSPYDKFLKAA